MPEKAILIKNTSGLWAGVKHVLCHHVARKGLVTFVDQLVVSGVGYCVAVLFNRYAAQSEYGAFVMVLTVLGLALSFQSGIVTGPLTMLAPTFEGAKSNEFISALFALQLGIGLLFSAMIGGYVWVLHLKQANPALIQGMAALGIVLFVIQFQEFFRRTLMAKLEMNKALLNDLVFSGCKLAMVGYLVYQGVFKNAQSNAGLFTSAHVVLGYGLAGLVSVVFGLIQIRKYLTWRVDSIRGHLKQNWKLGKWLVLSRAVSLLQIEMMIWLLYSFNGLDSLALLDGLRLIVAPAILMIMAWGNMIGPMAAKHYSAEGLGSLQTFMKKASAVLIGVVVLLVVCVLVTPNTYLGYLLSVKYLSDWSTLCLWGLVAVVMAFSTSYATFFFATHHPKYSLYCKGISGLLGLPCYVLFIFHWGVLGAVAARLLVEVIQCGVAYVSVKRLIKDLGNDSSACLVFEKKAVIENIAA